MSRALRLIRSPLAVCAIAGASIVGGLATFGIATSADEATVPTPLPNLFQFALLHQPAVGTFRLPQGIAVGLDGSVYTIEAGQLDNVAGPARVQRFTPGGALRNVWGALGVGDGRFRRPVAIAVAPAGAPQAGRVYVADELQRRIQIFEPNGRFAGDLWPRLPDGGAVTPIELAIGPDGRVYVVDLATRRVPYYLPDGSVAGELKGTWVRRQADYGASVAVSGDGASIVVAMGHYYVIENGASRDVPGTVHVFDHSGAERLRWEDKQAGGSNTNTPVGAALLADGTLLIANNSGGLITRFGLDGQVLQSVAPAGITMAGMSVAPDGTPWLLGGNQVLRLDPSLQLVGSWGGPAADLVSDLLDLAPAPDGTMLLSADDAGVYRFGPEGEFVDVWRPPGVVYISDLAPAPDGTLFLTDPRNKRVLRYDKTRQQMQTVASGGNGPGQLDIPTGLALGTDGSLFISDDFHCQVHHYAADGRYLHSWGSRGTGDGLFPRIGALATNLDGTLWASSFTGTVGGSDLQLFAPDGTFLRRLGGPGVRPGRFKGPQDMVVNAAGELLVVEVDNQRVQRFDRHGMPIGLWGSAGVGPGEFIEPGSVAVDGGGRVWVADSGAPRIQVFAPRLPEHWRVEVFDNPWLTGWPRAVTSTQQVDLAWGASPLAPGLAVDGTSARVSRNLWQPGRWRMRVQAQGGVRAWVGERVLVDDWDAAAVDVAPEVVFPAAATFVEIQLRDAAGSASLSVSFEPVDVPTVPATATPSPFPPATLTPRPWPTRTPRATEPPGGSRRLYLPWLMGGAGKPYEPPSVLPWLANPAIDVQHYDVELVVPALNGQPLQARAALTIAAREPLRWIDLAVEPGGVTVNDVSQGAMPRRWVVVPGTVSHAKLKGNRLSVELEETLPVGVTTTLRIDYTIRAPDPSQPGGFQYELLGNSPVLSNVGWPYYTRFWLPSNDHPDDPASLSLTLHVPPDMVGAANGMLAGGDYVNGNGLDDVGLRVFRWREDVPMPTYGFHVAVGDFTVYSEPLCFNADPAAPVRVACDGARHEVPLVAYVPAGASYGTTQRARVAQGAAAAAYFSAVFDPYPYGKLGFAWEPHPFNMEYPGLIALPSFDAAVHEVLHHWWGNRVLIGNWGDFWLSEGIVTYLTGLYDEVKTGKNTSCSQPTGKLNWPADTDPLKNFDEVPYCKGAAAFADLRARLAVHAGLAAGDPAERALFLAALDDVFEAFRGRHLDRDALVKHLQTRLPAVFTRQGLALDAAAATDLVDTWRLRWLEAPAAEDAVVAASWSGGSENVWAVEGRTWTKSLATLGPVSAPLAYVGSACDGAVPEQDPAGKVALVSPGTCSVANKVMNAQHAGALGVILLPTGSSKNPPSCPSPCPVQADIPAVTADRVGATGLKDRVMGGVPVTVTLRTLLP